VTLRNDYKSKYNESEQVILLKIKILSILRSYLHFVNMVFLHVKHGEESQFLSETTTNVSVDELVSTLLILYNGRLKIDRLCSGESNNFKVSA